MYRSLHPPLDIPATPLAEFVLAGAAARGERPALVCAVTGRSVSYAALPELVDRTAVGLAALGIAKGDVCAIFAANSPEYVIAVLAIARLGAVVTTASPAYTKDDLAKQLRDSGARVLLTSQLLAPIWTQSIAGTAVEHVVMFDDPGAVAAQVDAEVLRFDALAAIPGVPPRVTIDPDDLVALPYSSGTTGLPKGVMLTHRNLVANILQTDGAGHYIDGEDTTIAFLPFFHIYGLTVIVLMGVWAGATLVVVPKFDLEHYLDLVERHRATLLHVVPPIVLAIAKHPSVAGRDFSSIRKLFSGAAPLGARRHRAMHAPHRLHPAARLWPHGNEPGGVHHPGGHGDQAGIGRLARREHGMRASSTSKPAPTSRPARTARSGFAVRRSCAAT